MDPRFAPAAVNLADLHRATGRDMQGERVLRAAGYVYAVGLGGTGRTKQAIEVLERVLVGVPAI